LGASVVAVPFSEFDFVMVLVSEAEAEDREETAVETAYSDFARVSEAVTCSFVFVTVPETAPVGTCAWPSLISCTRVADSVFLGASDEEDCTFEFEMPNWVEYWKSPPAAIILRPKPELPVGMRLVGGVQE